MNQMKAHMLSAPHSKSWGGCGCIKTVYLPDQLQPFLTLQTVHIILKSLLAASADLLRGKPTRILIKAQL